MDNTAVEKRKRITHPYKDMYTTWKRIAFGCMVLIALLAALFLWTLKGNADLHKELAAKALTSAKK